jgi:hypothetical protein
MKIPESWNRASAGNREEKTTMWVQLDPQTVPKDIKYLMN